MKEMVCYDIAIKLNIVMHCVHIVLTVNICVLIILVGENALLNEDCDMKLTDTDWDEHSHKATRTLFVGNLDKDITSEILRSQFKCFGKILVIV